MTHHYHDYCSDSPCDSLSTLPTQPALLPSSFLIFFLILSSSFFLSSRTNTERQERETESPRGEEQRDAERERERFREIEREMRVWERETERRGKEIGKIGPDLLVDELGDAGETRERRRRDFRRTRGQKPINPGAWTRDPNPTDPREPVWPDPSGGSILHVRRFQQQFLVSRDLCATTQLNPEAPWPKTRTCDPKTREEDPVLPVCFSAIFPAESVAFPVDLLWKSLG
jgi:hypothetical protein